MSREVFPSLPNNEMLVHKVSIFPELFQQPMQWLYCFHKIWIYFSNLVFWDHSSLKGDVSSAVWVSPPESQPRKGYQQPQTNGIKWIKFFIISVFVSHSLVYAYQRKKSLKFLLEGPKEKGNLKMLAHHALKSGLKSFNFGEVFVTT